MRFTPTALLGCVTALVSAIPTPQGDGYVYCDRPDQWQYSICDSDFSFVVCEGPELRAIINCNPPDRYCWINPENDFGFCNGTSPPDLDSLGIWPRV
ncbi:hypothetical protein F5Y18DRAFT_174750 [Xylariaceae sp. FL1019]|nr:hypothetical protein F5Y18DRAFT_174750 [Xylariaceae sp. FL1019]